ncbi:MAG: serine O-acetyltransferase [Pseudomonadales bacterium]
MGVDIPVGTQIGPRLTIYHGFGLVINPSAIIGSDCQLRHGVTIGNKLIAGQETKSPVLGDHVELGANCSIIGDISIGSNCIIGANTVVTKSLADHSVAVGCSARIIPSREPEKKGSHE